jgi:hypothetical protein
MASAHLSGAQNGDSHFRPLLFFLDPPAFLHDLAIDRSGEIPRSAP